MEGPVDTTPYEQYLPVDDQFDKSIPIVTDELDALYDYNLEHFNQMTSPLFEASMNYPAIYKLSELLAKASPYNPDTSQPASRELQQSHYRGLTIALETANYISKQSNLIIPVDSVFQTEGGTGKLLVEYVEQRPNLYDYVYTRQEKIAGGKIYAQAAATAAMLGFLLTERGNGMSYFKIPFTD